MRDAHILYACFILSLCFCSAVYRHSFWHTPISKDTAETNEVACGDLLQLYAEKPDVLEFLNCKHDPKHQILAEATYRISGTHVKEMEDFFIYQYGMGKLKWVCCGWETKGQYGQFEHPLLKKINPYCSGLISMYAEGITEQYEYFEKEDIPYFTVCVQIVIV